VPRSPIAELIETGFSPWYSGPPIRQALDLCCGGGCIGLALAHHLRPGRVDLSDIDPDALALAAENRRELGLEGVTQLYRSDLFEALPRTRYDLIVTNPPYVDAPDLSGMPAEYRHEPAAGLGAGQDGLDLARRILRAAPRYLQPHGLLIMEVGNSAPALEAAFPRLPFIWPDLQHGGHGVLVIGAAELAAVSQLPPADRDSSASSGR